MGGDTAGLIDLAPDKAAEVLVERADDAWLSELQRSLDRRRSRTDLDRILAVWDLSLTEAAGLFGITRQGVAKWRKHGIPGSRIEALTDLSAATDLLVRYLRRDRIPAVVRRRSKRMGGHSLLDLVAAGRTRDVLFACRSMFQFGDAHG